jgi:hypothetical protein
MKRRSHATTPTTALLIRGVPPATAARFRAVAERNGWTHGRALGRLVELYYRLVTADGIGELTANELFATLGFRR